MPRAFDKSQSLDPNRRCPTRLPREVKTALSMGAAGPTSKRRGACITTQYKHYVPRHAATRRVSEKIEQDCAFGNGMGHLLHVRAWQRRPQSGISRLRGANAREDRTKGVGSEIVCAISFKFAIVNRAEWIRCAWYRRP